MTEPSTEMHERVQRRSKFQSLKCLQNIWVKRLKVKEKWSRSVFATPWTVAHQAPLSMEFSRQESGVGCHFLLQGIFLTQGSNPSLLHCRQTLYHLSPQGSPKKVKRGKWKSEAWGSNIYRFFSFFRYSVMGNRWTLLYMKPLAAAGTWMINICRQWI